MNKIKVHPEKELPPEIKSEIVFLLDSIWPDLTETREGKNLETPIHDLSLNPICVMLVNKDGRILSYAAILSKKISHEGNSYQIAGLSCVATQQNQRSLGYGKKVVEVATQLIIENNAIDVGLFTCDHNIVPFYSKCGWSTLNDSYLIGGTREKPFPSNEHGKTTLIRFLSDKAKKNAKDFSKSPIYLELKEGDLW